MLWLSRGVQRGSVGIWLVILGTSALLPRSCMRCFPSLVPVPCLAWGDDRLAAVCVLKFVSTPVTSGLWAPGVLWSSWPPASPREGVGVQQPSSGSISSCAHTGETGNKCPGAKCCRCPKTGDNRYLRICWQTTVFP